MFQDLGRPGYSHLGVSIAGAADPVSMRVANRLVGNPEDVVVIECTLQGPRLRFVHGAVVAICGAEFEDCNLPLWKAHIVTAGFVLEMGGCRLGARAYIAVQGGFECSRVLGSGSVHLLSGFGNALRRGEVLTIVRCVPVSVDCDVSVSPPEFRKVLRVVEGPDAGEFSSSEIFRFFAEDWLVTEDSNRQGLRLRGNAFGGAGHGSKLSEGVDLGAIQVTPAGDPVILFVDSQTTGGYPVIANVIAADRMSLGQLRPRDRVRFTPVSLAEARQALLDQEEWIRHVGHHR
jgi:antagonist of KipI